jgi:Holliday junction DNA helicase RuvA
MIARLHGRVVGEGEGGALVIDVGGVGYEVVAPLGTRGRLEEEAATIFVHTHVREDALQLFGFATEEERDAFRVVIGISNVGPKLGLALLGSLSVHELAEAVGRGDGAKLTAIPGVGKKTAERLVLELKGKLAPTSPRPVRAGGAAAAAPHATGKNSELLLGALTRMGYRPAEAERAISALSASQDLETAALGDLVREALAALAR